MMESIAPGAGGGQVQAGDRGALPLGHGGKPFAWRLGGVGQPGLARRRAYLPASAGDGARLDRPDPDAGGGVGLASPATSSAS